MTKPVQHEPGLPADLVARMQDLAERKTVDKHPFPGLDRSIHRDRRVRFGQAVAAAATVLAVAAGAVVVGGSLSSHDTSAPASTPKYAQALEEAGYSATTSGTLADDDTWLEGLRQQVFKESEVGITSADDVQVVAAGDVEDKVRYAVVLYPTTEAAWKQEIWTGKAGAKPKAMQKTGGNNTVSEDGVSTAPVMAITTARDRIGTEEANFADDPLVVVTGPQSQSATVLSKQVLKANGKYTTKRREIPSVAPGVWVDLLTVDEYGFADVEVDGSDRIDGTSSGVWKIDLRSVAPAGTTENQLSVVNLALQGAGRSEEYVAPDEEPVYAAYVQVEDKVAASVALLRAASGAYHYALVEQQTVSGKSNDASVLGTIAAGDEPGEVMAAMRAKTGTVNRYVVLAPENATTVRVGNTTATVKNRIAVVDVPTADDPGKKPQQAQALNSSGQVIATTDTVQS